jgi:hypothetical protein
VTAHTHTHTHTHTYTYHIYYILQSESSYFIVRPHSHARTLVRTNRLVWNFLKFVNQILFWSQSDSMDHNLYMKTSTNFGLFWEEFSWSCKSYSFQSGQQYKLYSHSLSGMFLLWMIDANYSHVDMPVLLITFETTGSVLWSYINAVLFEAIQLL